LPRLLIVDTARESRDAVVEQLVDEGYELFATGSLDVACALALAGQMEVILIHLSAFPARSLGKLGRALAHRRRIRVLGLVSQFMGGASMVTRVLRLPRAEALTFGFQSSHPN
jgi:DNA-binding response OmpR family regulator